MTYRLTQVLLFIAVFAAVAAFAFTAKAQSANLITNGSLETANGSAPASWFSDYWGSPVPTFTYPAAGNNGTKGASVTLTSNSTGDAEWKTSAPVAVTAGTTYTYSTSYNSNVATEIDAEYTNTSGSVSYAWLADVPSSAGAWKQLSVNFTVPSGITKATIYQLIFNKGTMTIDDVSLVPVGSTTPPPPPPPPPPPSAPTVSISATPTLITFGQSSTLNWSSTNATGCTASNGWSGAKALSGSQSVSPTATTTYALTCVGAGGTTTQQTTISVTSSTPPSMPTVTFSASPTSITSGQSSILTWSSTNASSCTASLGWSGTKATSGTQSVSPTATTTYSISCTGGGGTASGSATVNVTVPATPQPTLTFTVSPTQITSGQSATLSWSTTNATGCTASNGWTGSKAVSGTQSVAPTATTTYALSCTGAGGSIAKSVTLNVSPSTVVNPNQFSEGMVTLSFDDAWASQYTNALPVLQASGLPATFYFISEVIQNNANFPGYMTPSMATTIANDGYEIADHTVTHPDLTTLSTTQINNEIINSRTYLQNLTGKTITDIAYPYGAVNTTVKNLVKQAGYAVGRGVDDGQLNIPSSDKYNLYSQCVESTESLATIKSWIDKAKTNKQWYILCFHDIGAAPDQYNIPTSEFQQIVNYIKSTGIKTVTVAQGRALMSN